MTYRFAFCDDDAAQLENLRLLVAQWAAKNGHTAHISSFSSAEEFFFHYADEKGYDVLLLDIEMPGMTGVDLARKVRRENREVQIVFITGYMDYIAEGYDVEALNYLIKPVTREKLFEVLTRAAEKLKLNERALMLDIGDEIVRVPVYDIRLMEVRRNYVTVFAGEEYTVRSSLGELESQLGDGFFRVGRSFIVNLLLIKKVTKTEITLRDGTIIPLPRGAYEAVNKAIIERL